MVSHTTVWRMSASVICAFHHPRFAGFTRWRQLRRRWTRNFRYWCHSANSSQIGNFSQWRTRSISSEVHRTPSTVLVIHMYFKCLLIVRLFEEHVELFRLSFRRCHFYQILMVSYYDRPLSVGRRPSCSVFARHFFHLNITCATAHSIWSYYIGIILGCTLTKVVQTVAVELHK